jgi:hypothetical protein
MWEMARRIGLDQKELAEALYKVLLNQNVPEVIVETVVQVLCENDMLHGYIEENFATKEELEDTDKTLAKHKHLPNGKAAEEL